MFLFSSYFFTNFSLVVLIKFVVKKSDSIKRELQISMFSIPDIRAGNLARCTRDLLRNNIEIIRVFLQRPSIQIMLSNFKNDGILRIASDPWRANILLYKNVAVARIILYKNTYSTLSLTVANNQITSVCTQVLIQNVVMVVYGSKID